jgi:hypothetical protein
LEWEEEEDNWYSLDQVPTTSHLVKTKRERERERGASSSDRQHLLEVFEQMHSIFLKAEYSCADMLPINCCNVSIKTIYKKRMFIQIICIIRNAPHRKKGLYALSCMVHGN